jgi:hypothetical protein
MWSFLTHSKQNPSPKYQTPSKVKIINSNVNPILLPTSIGVLGVVFMVYLELGYGVGV